MWQDDPEPNPIARWFRSLTMTARIQIIMFSVVGVVLAIVSGLALIKDPIILLPATGPDAVKVAGEPERAKAVEDGKTWRSGEGILSAKTSQGGQESNDGEVRALRKMVEMDPKDAGALDRLGKALYLQGKYQEAEKAFTDGLALQPDNTEMLANLGVALKTSGRVKQYDEVVAKLSALDPQKGMELKVFTVKGAEDKGKQEKPMALPTPSEPKTATEKQAQNQGELGALRQLVAMDPKDADNWDKLGKALYQNGDYEEAVGMFQKSLELKPGVLDVVANLGVTLKAKGDYANFDKLLLEVQKTSPETAAALKAFQPPKKP